MEIVDLRSLKQPSAMAELVTEILMRVVVGFKYLQYLKLGRYFEYG